MSGVYPTLERGLPAGDWYVKQIVEEVHSAGWGFTTTSVHSGTSSHPMCSAATMNLQQGLPDSCRFAGPRESSCVAGVERAQLTVAWRPRGLGHVCKQLHFSGGCQTSVRVSVRQVSNRVVLGKHRRCPWHFGSRCSPKLFFFI